MKPSAVMSWGTLFFCASTQLGCQNYGDQLQRAQSYYERNQYEMALAVVRNLEADQDSLTQPEAVVYCYVRGMTDYRLGYRDDARYWLGLAKASLSSAPTALAPEESKRLEESLAELNAPIFGISEPNSEEGSAQSSTSPSTSPSTSATGPQVAVAAPSAR